MAVSWIIEFKQNSQEAAKNKERDMVDSTAFPPLLSPSVPNKMRIKYLPSKHAESMT